MRNPGKIPVTPEEFDAVDGAPQEAIGTYLVVAGVIAVVVIVALVVWSLAA